MRIGSTPPHEFELPISAEDLSAIEITYSQNDRVILQLREYDCEVEGNTVRTTLSQEDTFLFTPDVIVEIQIRVKDGSGSVIPSNIMRVACEKCLSHEVI